MSADRSIAIFHVRESRSKAMGFARGEALAVLAAHDPQRMDGGPLTGQEKVFCLSFDESVALENLQGEFARLGYSEKLSRAVETSPGNNRKSRPTAIPWKGRFFELETLFEEDVGSMRRKDPDQRSFKIKSEDGSIKEIRSYRGHGEHFGRRALPVPDCRLLVNFAMRDAKDGIVLDPFAGAGGIVIEIKEFGLTPYSMDSDASLEPGLGELSARHFASSASKMSGIGDASIDGIATEIPFEPKFDDAVLMSLSEMRRVLKPGTRAALMTSARQKEKVEKAAAENGFEIVLADVLDRKGTEVSVILLQR